MQVHSFTQQGLIFRPRTTTQIRPTIYSSRKQNQQVIQSLFGGPKQKEQTVLENGKAQNGGAQGIGGFLQKIFGTTQVFQGKGKGKQDGNTVFLGGATGRLGFKVLRELIESGYKVRCGVRSQESAEEKLQELKEAQVLNRQQENNIKFVQWDIQDEESISRAVGNASKIVCAVGANEGQLKNAKFVDGVGTINLIKAAEDLDVQQFVLVTSMGTAKFGLPASLLNLFGGVLSEKRKAEKVLEASKMAYTIVRPGGMERPKDDYKETHNLVLSPKDTKWGGQVSRLQVAELISTIISEPALAENKIVEVYADDKAPLRDTLELLEEIDSEITQEEKLERIRAVEQADSKLEELKNYLEDNQEELRNIQEQYEEVLGSLQELQSESKTVLERESQFKQEIQGLQQELEEQEEAESELVFLIGELKAAKSQDKFIDEKQQKSIIQAYRQDQMKSQQQQEEEQEKRMESQAAAQKQQQQKPKQIQGSGKELKKPLEQVENATQQAQQQVKKGVTEVQQKFQQGLQKGKQNQGSQQSMVNPQQAQEKLNSIINPKSDPNDPNDPLNISRKIREQAEQERIKQDEQVNAMYEEKRKQIQAAIEKEQQEEIQKRKEAQKQSQQQEQEAIKRRQEEEKQRIEGLKMRQQRDIKESQNKMPKVEEVIKAAPQPKVPSQIAKPAAKIANTLESTTQAAKSTQNGSVQPNVQEARDWINSWRQGNNSQSGQTKTPEAKSSNGSLPPNVKEAREWIQNWRKTVKPQDLAKK